MLNCESVSQTLLTNPSKLRICLCRIPTVITETLIVSLRVLTGYASLPPTEKVNR